jgi:FG-GAP repeat protein
MDPLRRIAMWRVIRGSTALLGLLLVLSPSASGQAYDLYQLPGSAGGDRFGASVAGAGDVDGDGFADLLVGAPGIDASAFFLDAGGARVLSGANGAILLAMSGVALAEQLGQVVARAGDVDADGTVDFVLGSQLSLFTLGAARVFSGAGGAQLYAFIGGQTGTGLGMAVAGIGDLDGDGHAEVAVGEPYYLNFVSPFFPGYGRVRVFSGASGGVLLDLVGAAPGDAAGYSVAGPGDLDGDGVPDVFVGTPRPESPVAINQPGGAVLFSGATGGPIFTFTGIAGGDLLGSSVADAGDIDGDSVHDLAAGAPNSPGFPGGLVRVFSGTTGTLLYTLTPGPLGMPAFGRSVSGAGDVNADGVPDIAVGSRPGPISQGRVTVHSGANGTVLYFVGGSALVGSFGNTVAGAGDVNGDGFSDVIAGDVGQNGTPGEARVFSYTGIPAGSSTFGAGCPGSGGFVPRVTTAGGPPAPGQPDFRVYGSKMLGGTVAVLILGISSNDWSGVPLPLNLAFLGLPSCSLFVSGEILLPAIASGSGPGAGAANRLVPAPPDPSLSGLAVFLQWFVVDPGPLALPAAMSEALQVVIP